jgi:hypothetical protein
MPTTAYTERSFPIEENAKTSEAITAPRIGHLLCHLRARASIKREHRNAWAVKHRLCVQQANITLTCTLPLSPRAHTFQRSNTTCTTISIHPTDERIHSKMQFSTTTASLLLATLASATQPVRRQDTDLCTADYPDLSCCKTTATELALADCQVGE